MTKYKLPFVNEGKPFEIPNWTVEKHESALKSFVEYKKKEKCTDDFFSRFVILEGLKAIDSSVSLEDIKNLHPENITALFNAVYNAGKVDIVFREDELTDSPPKKKPKKKE